ncbi:MAG: MAPEG family protein [Bdellovibrionota bacterium]
MERKYGSLSSCDMFMAMITELYTALLAIVFFAISLRVILLRRKLKISYGYGKNLEIIGPVSAHSNFVSYVPFLLIMMFFVETSSLDISSLALHILGSAILLGRIFHALALFSQKPAFVFRILGMQMTLWPMLTLSSLMLWNCYQNWV